MTSAAVASTRDDNAASPLREPLLEHPADNGEDSIGEDAPTFWGLAFFKALYFLNGLSASTWGRFGVIYYNEVCHFPPQQIGILQGIAPLLSFISMPLWGIVADCIHSRKHVYVFCKIISTASLLALAVVPHSSFGAVMLCVAGMSLFRASGVLDAHVLDYLGSTHKSRYGSIRLWTAISWGLGAVAMGWITDRFESFEWNFILFGTMMVILLTVVVFGLPARSKQEQARYEQQEEEAATMVVQGDNDDDATTSNVQSRHPRPRVLFQALCRVPVILWLVQVIVIGTGMAVVESFLFVYLQNDLHASTRLCGLTVGITVLFEIPIFHYSKFLLQTVGHDALFSVSMLAYIIRAFGYTFLTESSVQYGILLLEILHGITFASMWIASIDFSAAVAPTEWSTTVQTILSGSFACFGSVVGSTVGGYILQHYSAIVLYRGMGCIVTVVWLMHIITWRCCGGGHDSFLALLKEEEQDEQNQDDDDDETPVLGENDEENSACIHDNDERDADNAALSSE